MKERSRTSPSSKSLVATPPTPRALDLANVVVSPPRAIAPCARSHAARAATATAGSTRGGGPDDVDDVEGARRRSRRRRRSAVNRRFVSSSSRASSPSRARDGDGGDARDDATATRDVARRDATRATRRATTLDSMTTAMSSSAHRPRVRVTPAVRPSVDARTRGREAR